LLDGVAGIARSAGDFHLALELMAPRGIVVVDLDFASRRIGRVQPEQLDAIRVAVGHVADFLQAMARAINGPVAAELSLGQRGKQESEAESSPLEEDEGVNMHSEKKRLGRGAGLLTERGESAWARTQPEKGHGLVR
jgi:hypothetical protein